jgi:pimeloyl-ACP methyl ester carboxylesterase
MSLWVAGTRASRRLGFPAGRTGSTAREHNTSARPGRGSLRSSAALLVILVGLSACRSPIGVLRTGFEPIYRAQSASVLDTGEPSTATSQFLAFVGLDQLYASSPDDAIQQLETFALAERRRRPFVALAELRYAQALKKRDQGRFLASAVHAYLFLFSEELQPEPDPYDPLFRLACDIYNRSLAQALLTKSGEVDLRDQVIATPAGPFQIRVQRPGFPWSQEDFSRFLPADAFQVRGLRERVRASGLGVPLIAIRAEGSRDGPRQRHSARDVKLPATALLRIEGGLRELADGSLSGTLELYFPPDFSEVTIAGKRVPLEADFTAPLAFSLEASPIWDFSLRGFLKGEDTREETGVYMTQPYQAGRIPVVLLHGTASNPAEWSQMLNGLVLDPALRGRYQLWVGLYSTGNPVLYSAGRIRTSLANLIAELDPEGSDPALSQMVVVGHSQGGLVTRLLVSSSGDRIWNGISSEPFDDCPLTPEARELLESCLFFEPLPFVTRAVFISTPHRGSFLAAGWIGRFTRRLVSVAKEITSSTEQLKKAEGIPADLRENIPTSVDNMDPDSIFVRALGTLPFSPHVRLHSIVAVDGQGPAAEGDDGVVAYSSAHLEEVESELIVRHGHSCQNEPEAILELRRILLEHLRTAP